MFEMRAHAPGQNVPSAGRRFGYLVGAGINAVLYYLVNGQPGWQVVPFLTADLEKVLPLINLSFALGVITNLLFFVRDPRWLRLLGGIATTTVGLMALWRLREVLPFDFGDTSVNWQPWARLSLLVLAVLTGIALVVQVGQLLTLPLRRDRNR